MNRTEMLSSKKYDFLFLQFSPTKKAIASCLHENEEKESQLP